MPKVGNPASGTSDKGATQPGKRFDIQDAAKHPKSYPGDGKAQKGGSQG